MKKVMERSAVGGGGPGAGFWDRTKLEDSETRESKGNSELRRYLLLLPQNNETRFSRV